MNWDDWLVHQYVFGIAQLSTAGRFGIASCTGPGIAAPRKEIDLGFRGLARWPWLPPHVSP